MRGPITICLLALLTASCSPPVSDPFTDTTAVSPANSTSSPITTADSVAVDHGFLVGETTLCVGVFDGFKDFDLSTSGGAEQVLIECLSVIELEVFGGGPWDLYCTGYDIGSTYARFGPDPDQRLVTSTTFSFCDAIRSAEASSETQDRSEFLVNEGAAAYVVEYSGSATILDEYGDHGQLLDELFDDIFEEPENSG